MQTIARSISRPLRERLRQRPFVARVLAVFARACNLLTHDGQVVALVTSQVGDGPFNVVIEGARGCFAGIEPGDENRAVTLKDDVLQVNGLRVDLGMAKVWEPRPDWDALRARRAGMTARLPSLHALSLRYAPANSLLALLDSRPGGDTVTNAISATAQEAARALRQGWRGDLERLQRGAMGLAGLGNGLTPSGDDFLGGAMLWAWLAHPAPDSLCDTLVQVAAPRTTTLSAAFLRAAARGEWGALWHALLAALSAGEEAKIAAVVHQVLAHGATSGADSLAGFLYFGESS
ncbi:MAG: DUF2877 domain-containing protein [Anaerolineae bacterium]|jgi:hypothetical protein